MQHHQISFRVSADLLFLRRVPNHIPTLAQPLCNNIYYNTKENKKKKKRRRRIFGRKKWRWIEKEVHSSWQQRSSKVVVEERGEKEGRRREKNIRLILGLACGNGSPCQLQHTREQEKNEGKNRNRESGGCYVDRGEEQLKRVAKLKRNK